MMNFQKKIEMEHTKNAISIVMSYGYYCEIPDTPSDI